MPPRYFLHTNHGKKILDLPGAQTKKPRSATLRGFFIELLTLHRRCGWRGAVPRAEVPQASSLQSLNGLLPDRSTIASQRPAALRHGAEPRASRTGLRNSREVIVQKPTAQPQRIAPRQPVAATPSSRVASGPHRHRAAAPDRPRRAKLPCAATARFAARAKFPAAAPDSGPGC